MKKILILFLFLLSAILCGAGENGEHRYAQKQSPKGLCVSQSYIAIYFDEQDLYSVLGRKACTLDGPVVGFALNPTGMSMAVIWKTRKGTRMSIYANKTDGLITAPRLGYNPAVAAYSSDGRLLYVCDDGGTVHRVDSRSCIESGTFSLGGFMPKKMAASPNGDFLAVSDGEKLQVRIIKDGALRKEINLGTPINDFAFAPDNSYLAVLLDGGSLVEYETATFLPGAEISGLGLSRALAIHKDNKYVAVVTADSVLAVVNRMDLFDREYLGDVESGVSRPAFTERQPAYLVYSTDNSIVYKDLPFIKPNFHKLIAEEVDKRMDEWIKQMPGESLSEYTERVSDENRAKQMALFEEEIATRMAEGSLEASQISLGSYNAESGLLSLNISSMPTIFLSVGAASIASFANVEDLTFNNPKYGVTADDKFELVYVEVHNNKTGEDFVFDNRERKSLEYLRTSDKFVPMELMQLSNMEALALEEIKENVLKDAQEQSTITDHTHIAVSTKVEKGVDAYGKDILNYKIGYTYDVEKEFSARDDFAPGKYIVEDSPAATAMIEIIKKSFEGSFSKYVKSGHKVKVSITGMADNLKIGGKIPYNGVYGKFVDEPVYGESLYALTVTPETGITANDQLAFVRAAGVKQYIEKHVPELSKTDVQYEYHIVVSDQTGGAHRRISVAFTFFDAF